MADFVDIAAKPRDVIGKSGHRLAPQGLLPAVVYGVGHKPTPISLDRHDFEKLLAHTALASALIHLDIEGRAEPLNVLVKEMQTHPVKGHIMHVDFWAIKMTQTIQTAIPVRFEGESPGVKAGGVLTHSTIEITVESLPANIPDFVMADISALEVGDSVHVSELIVPEGVTIVSAADDIVASVTPPTVVPVEEEEVAEVEGEPEVIGETKEEE